ncbi:hypothetical protein NH448_17860 [Halomonas sp. OfavH-34-E]|nr:hypothetical protein [Halomonas sp. OfavH-34-E]
MLSQDWELVDPDVNPLLSVVPCKWPAHPDRYDNIDDALKLIRGERVRQVSKEGFTPDHDDQYADGELMAASICYLLAAVLQNAGLQAHRQPPTGWPWASEWWRPAGGARRNLVKAGALLLSELERMDRTEA